MSIPAKLLGRCEKADWAGYQAADAAALRTELDRGQVYHGVLGRGNLPPKTANLPNATTIESGNGARIMSAFDPKRTSVIRPNLHSKWYTYLSGNTDKAKPAERRGRKATGPRFLREAMEDSPKDPKIAGFPTSNGGKKMTRNIIFRSMLGLGGLATLMLMTGCATAQSLSQGSVPCQEDAMEIIDETKAIGGNPTSWTVICRDKRYYCSARYGQYSAPAVNCVLADE